MTQAAAITTRERAVEASAAPRERAIEATPRREIGPPRRLRRRAIAPHAPPPHRAVEAPPKAQRGAGLRRFVLIVVIPAVAAALALFWWLSTGRYVSTDNAFVGAEKTRSDALCHRPDRRDPRQGGASGQGRRSPIRHRSRAVRDRAGSGGRAGLAAAKIEFANLKSQYASNVDQIKMGEESVRLHQTDFDRKHKLVETLSGSRPTRTLPRWRSSRRSRSSSSCAAAGYGEGQARRRTRRVDRYVSRLHPGQGRGRRRRTQPGLHPRQGAHRRHRDAGAADRARPRRAGRAAGVRHHRRQGTLGRRQPQGIRPDLREGGPAGDCHHRRLPRPRLSAARVCSIAPGTGAQFAILPPQNASGNWVKVVQRVPLRFCFAPDEDTEGLRAGMSADRLDRHRPRAQPERPSALSPGRRPDGGGEAMSDPNFGGVTPLQRAL